MSSTFDYRAFEKHIGYLVNSPRSGSLDRHEHYQKLAYLSGLMKPLTYSSFGGCGIPGSDLGIRALQLKEIRALTLVLDYLREQAKEVEALLIEKGVDDCE